MGKQVSCPNTALWETGEPTDVLASYAWCEILGYPVRARNSPALYIESVYGVFAASPQILPSELAPFYSADFELLLDRC